MISKATDRIIVLERALYIEVDISGVRGIFPCAGYESTDLNLVYLAKCVKY